MKDERILFADSNSYFPVIQAGKFIDMEEKKMMPLSITVHHAVADGYHVSEFLERFKIHMAYPEDWIDRQNCV